MTLTSRGIALEFAPASTDYERLKELDRRVLRLDETPDSDIEAMVQAEIPAAYRYDFTW
jgi:hypothetical protein